MVSGHPLDGIMPYCQRRSRNVSDLKTPLEDLHEKFKKDEKKFKDDLQKRQLQTV